MSIPSKLFATVALPVFAVSFVVQPALAESLMAPFQVAQEGSDQQSPEDLLLLKKHKKQKAAEEGQTEQQQPQAEAPQRQAEEPSRKKRKQQAEEQQPGSEESAPRQAEEQQAPERKKRKQQAEQQQPGAEEGAPRQAEEQQAPQRKKHKQQAEEQQPAVDEGAPRQAEEQQAPERKKRKQQAEEQQPAVDEAAPRQAEEQQAPERKKRKQQAQEQQPAVEGETPQQAEGQQAPASKKRKQQAEGQQPTPEDSTPQQTEEQQVTTPKKRKQQAEGQQPATEEGTPQNAEQQQVPVPKKRKQQAEGQQEEQKALEKNAVPSAEQPTPQTGEGEQQPVPGSEQPATAEQRQGEEPQAKPAPVVVDKRTKEEKRKIAQDPAATDETVVLPVDNGAAVLDSDKDADKSGGDQGREARRKQREELRVQEKNVAPPTDDAAAQAEIPADVRQAVPQRIEAGIKEEGRRVDAAPAFAVPDTTNIVNNTVINNTVINNTTVNNTTNNDVTDVHVVERLDDRVVLGVGDQIFVRGDDRPRLRHDAQEAYYDELPRGRVRETIVRPGGYRIVTVYDRYGDVLQRSRVDGDGNEYVLMYAPDYQDERRPAIVDVGYDLPPMRLTIPVDDYIVDYSQEPDRDYYEFLSEPPVERVERVYTIDEVRNSARLRDKVRRIDLDTIHFETGSAEVSMSQAKTLRTVADAMQKVLGKDPGETFFIEGHTDAVGSDRSNLVLSDERAESVAVLLTEVYGIPAENLVTQGYGERFLKISTQEPEEENRRVTIRRVTPLVRPVAQR
ncbi:OmpA family protein [Ensifer adhaerens]|uniref:OmpA family protein n=1 Tax=Ensifer adhaerens TaxID=106592 RepID=UPI001CBC1D90|nr:OmpA family protein [Ensifer adhaerens]MBZ7926387.1 OmpA family protein [Ensifer adhaerens]UAX97254.1 OmpA family protein [Ensifer adhaerens]UAY03627.1 OmpA family protein [Ensifer adhaerens]UAY11611.1 OmpA family protein [Ensifer adhaerens]